MVIIFNLNIIAFPQVDIGPYHAGLDPYHDLDLPRPHVSQILLIIESKQLNLISSQPSGKS